MCVCDFCVFVWCVFGVRCVWCGTLKKRGKKPVVDLSVGTREFICWFTDVDRSRGSEVVTVFRRPAKKELSVALALHASRLLAVLSSRVSALLLP